MSQQKIDEENRRAFRSYRGHALDEIQLMQMHAKALAKDEPELQKINAAFEDVKQRIVGLTSLIRRGAASDVPASTCEV